MELLVFGHGGARVLVFPTSMGRFYEWEDRGMLAALGGHLVNGWLQLICVDSVDSESWYADWAHPAQRAARHAQYERYLLEEVLPFSTNRNPDPYLIATGASFGAYHAANLAFRHPSLVGRVLGLSGLYDVGRFTGGYVDDTVYFYNPALYLPDEHDPGRLEQLRRLDIIFAIGREDPNYAANRWLSDVLWSKGIWHALRVWDGWCHDWPWWHQMLTMYIGGG
jgi:esterase/lipase superfamily enzyme